MTANEGRNTHDDDRRPETQASAAGGASWPNDLIGAEMSAADAAELREAWTTLDQLLGPNAAAPLDEVTTARVVRKVVRRAELRRRRRAGLLVLAAAAALLLFIGKPRLPENATHDLAQQNAVNQNTANQNLAQNATTPNVAVPATALAWEDPWDQELADAQAEARDVELNWSRDDDRLTHLSESLQALEAEWSASPL